MGNELTGDEHEDSRGGDVGRTGLPAAADPDHEGHEDEEEADDEHRDHRPRHVYKIKINE